MGDLSLRRTPSRLVLLWGLEAFAALFAIAEQGAEDDGIGFARRAYVVHFDGLSLELFVILEEAPQHDHAMGWHLGRFAVGIELGILGGHGDDLVVLLAGVDHGHQ